MIRIEPITIIIAIGVALFFLASAYFVTEIDCPKDKSQHCIDKK